MLLDALSRAPACLTASPVIRSGRARGQLPDPGLPSYFLSLFGRSPRVTACACERNGDVTCRNCLHLKNGDSVVQKDRLDAGPPGKLLRDKKSDDADPR